MAQKEPEGSGAKIEFSTLQKRLQKVEREVTILLKGKA